jgi:hypothetical protein
MMPRANALPPIATRRVRRKQSGSGLPRRSQRQPGIGLAPRFPHPNFTGAAQRQWQEADSWPEGRVHRGFASLHRFGKRWRVNHSACSTDGVVDSERALFLTDLHSGRALATTQSNGIKLVSCGHGNDFAHQQAAD